MATIFVGNLVPEVTEGELRSLFETYGRVTSIRQLPRRRQAYVELSPEAADAAIAGLQGAQFKGRTLDVALDTSAGRRQGRGRFRSRR